jgi:hypothetical protein
MSHPSEPLGAEKYNAAAMPKTITRAEIWSRRRVPASSGIASRVARPERPNEIMSAVGSDTMRASDAVGHGDRREPLLGLAHRRAREAERAAELEDERLQRACVLARQPTICSSRGVLFRRRPPSSVTVTMSSMRTPKRLDR